MSNGNGVTATLSNAAETVAEKVSRTAAAVAAGSPPASIVTGPSGIAVRVVGRSGTPPTRWPAPGKSSSAEPYGLPASVIDSSAR